MVRSMSDDMIGQRMSGEKSSYYDIDDDCSIQETVSVISDELLLFV